jgi:hypothetical protein
MGFIYDGFPSREQAEAFRDAVRRSGRRADVWDSHNEMHEAFGRATSKVLAAHERGEKTVLVEDDTTAPVSDMFPFELTAPIVVVERRQDNEGDLERDDVVDAVADVEQYGGVFAGT